MKKNFSVGDTVQLTAKFLKSTGQYSGKDAHSKWKILSIDPGKHGSTDMVTVNQPRSDMSYFSAEEIAENPSLKWRRIAASNLKLVRSPEYFE